MAILVFLFGGICSTILGSMGWLFLGMGLIGALQLYIVANIAIVLVLLLVATWRQAQDMAGLPGASLAS